ncbi:protoporphyrinogen oxidase HemJ [bacterium]|nr:protoporphyrinogen oxidase HemJ [bacterium]
MLIIKALHIIAMVAWFAGLFYLPRLFVYHAEANDKISLDRFIVMERRLYYAIMWPAAVITSALGLWLLSDNLHYYLTAGWMQTKLFLIVLLWIYHLSCGHLLKKFAINKNTNGSRYYRILNELPTVLLIFIVLLVIVRPF